MTRKHIAVRIMNDGIEGFFKRSRARAKKMDRRVPLAPEIIINFPDAPSLLRVLSYQRVKLLKATKAGARSLDALASGLKRNKSAVNRDIQLLESCGLLRTHYEKNPGHGKYKVVEPVAQSYELVAKI
ncbi:MAG: hypothetical protein ABI383_09725 [Acidobacteriaceae bacterium]